MILSVFCCAAARSGNRNAGAAAAVSAVPPVRVTKRRRVISRPRARFVFLTIGAPFSFREATRGGGRDGCRPEPPAASVVEGLKLNSELVRGRGFRIVREIATRVGAADVEVVAERVPRHAGLIEP